MRTTPPVSPTSTSTAFPSLAPHKFCVPWRTPRAHGSAGREWSGGTTGWPETHRVTRAGSTATGAQPLSSRVEQPTPCVRGAHALPVAACCTPVCACDAPPACGAQSVRSITRQGPHGRKGSPHVADERAAAHALKGEPLTREPASKQTGRDGPLTWPYAAPSARWSSNTVVRCTPPHGLGGGSPC